MNMNREYRAELRILKQNLKSLERARDKRVRELQKQERESIRLHKRLRSQLARECARCMKTALKASTRITNRIAVLEGRLS